MDLSDSMESDGEESINLNYVFFLSEDKAVNHFTDMYKNTGRRVVTIDDLRSYIAFYDSGSPVKTTYMLMYNRPPLYSVIKKFSELIGREDVPDKLLAGFFLEAFDHEILHQIIDDYVGYRHNDSIKKLVIVEKLLHRLAKQGYMSK